jgi:serine phosphatase RsbU (regulator of sigma subunit)
MPAPVRLEAGGSLLVPSDGIFEAFDASDQVFGVERMCQDFDDNRFESPEIIVQAMRESVRRWSGGRDAMDDQTIVVVKRMA